MPAEPFPHVVACLRRAAAPAEADASDGELLGRFVATRDEASFAALVRRHGPTVLGVCRRILGSHADAEDACQAVFLILVRKAGSVRPPGMLAGWLHGVARNVSRRALRMAVRRQRHERASATRPRPGKTDPELRMLIDRELNRLPAESRTAIILCDVEGLTRSEAAGRLGWAEGTVASRLARGRQILARRLIRAGLGSGGALAAASVPELSAGVIESIVRVGLGPASTAPPAVLALTGGVLRAMSMKRYALILAVGLVAAGLTLTLRQVLPPAAAHVSTAGLIAVSNPTVPVKDDADAISVKTLPPVVVKTVPAAGTTDVDPATSEIKVTFSKDMTDESWSWSQLSDENFPKPAGDKPIHYEKDKRTCVLKVKLEPGKSYAIWLNSEKFSNFKDADGRPAVPYLLVFQTRKAD
jgi:RNA polymerase sigma-70 factor (ECF subfamily)